MSYQCSICGKGAQTGNVVSHSNIKSKTRFMPNLHNVKIRLNGNVKRRRVCASCIRSNVIEKVK